MHTIIQNAVLGNEIGCIPGHEQALELWAKRLQMVHQVLSVHIGHYDIGQKQMNLTRVLSGIRRLKSNGTKTYAKTTNLFKWLI